MLQAAPRFRIARRVSAQTESDLGTRDATIVLSVMALLVALIVAFLVLPATRPTSPEDLAPSATSAESTAIEEFDHVSRH